MNNNTTGAYFRAPVTIKTSTPADFIARLPGSPADRKTLYDIESTIASIERERAITRDKNLYADELALLEAYRSQVEQVISGGRP